MKNRFNPKFAFVVVLGAFFISQITSSFAIAGTLSRWPVQVSPDPVGLLLSCPSQTWQMRIPDMNEAMNENVYASYEELTKQAASGRGLGGTNPTGRSGEKLAPFIVTMPTSSLGNGSYSPEQVRLCFAEDATVGVRLTSNPCHADRSLQSSQMRRFFASVLAVPALEVRCLPRAPHAKQSCHNSSDDNLPQPASAPGSRLSGSSN